MVSQEAGPHQTPPAEKQTQLPKTRHHSFPELRSYGDEALGVNRKETVRWDMVPEGGLHVEGYGDVILKGFSLGSKEALRTHPRTFQLGDGSEVTGVPLLKLDTEHRGEVETRYLLDVRQAPTNETLRTLGKLANGDTLEDEAWEAGTDKPPEYALITIDNSSDRKKMHGNASLRGLGPTFDTTFGRYTMTPLPDGDLKIHHGSPDGSMLITRPEVETLNEADYWRMGKPTLPPIDTRAA